MWLNTLHREAVHREAVHREAFHREAVHREAVHREAVHSEAVHREAVHRENKNLKTFSTVFYIFDRFVLIFTYMTGKLNTNSRSPCSFFC